MQTLTFIVKLVFDSWTDRFLTRLVRLAKIIGKGKADGRGYGSVAKSCERQNNPMVI